MFTTIDSLKRAITIAEQIEQLQAELNQVLNGFGVVGGLPAKPAQKTSAPTAKPGRKKGGMSAAGRAAIIAAQKARWAKVKAANTGSAPAKTTTEAPKKKGKRTLSPEARAKIAEAQKKRWAKVKGTNSSTSSDNPNATPQKRAKTGLDSAPLPKIEAVPTSKKRHPSKKQQRGERALLKQIGRAYEALFPGLR